MFTRYKSKVSSINRRHLSSKLVLNLKRDRQAQKVTFKIPQQTIRVDEDFDITVTIQNPLPVPLNKGSFALDAPGIIKKIVTNRVKDCIKPGETGSVDFTLQPHKAGKRTITAKFYSTEIYCADGIVQMNLEGSRFAQNQQYPYVQCIIGRENEI
ncbi:unnamed protein product [Allacma fusca]|uniref:Transglutaminase C-terminal domain-containing protein n=1 Tax=Allacma fusca TaxID=39272 RepID=A0A8J2JIC1_9HEXA|nr:unnamed protein product [Allacma fusca]